MSRDPLGAFIPWVDLDIRGRAEGPLAGRRFAIKDFFDVAGAPTGAGSPEWLATHPTPTENAPVVDLLIDAGARLVGKTQTDELAWSLNGENARYGTPINPAAPGRVPGGSSSGSAAAVAGGLVDFAIGSDTGGSVRLPASYCGVIGMRPTHGRIPISGAVPLAPSYDTVGWFARDPALFAAVGRVLLRADDGAWRPRRLLIAADLFDTAGAAARTALADGIAAVTAALNLGAAAPTSVAEGALPAWRDAFRLIQSAEAWAAHGAWVTATRPDFGPGVKERFAAAAALDPALVAAARALRIEIRARLTGLLNDDALLIVPTAPGIAPLRDTPALELEGFRARALELLCPAGHAGLPQLSLPLGRLDHCPLGLGVIAPAGRDAALLDLADLINPGRPL